jgi:WD40 repeat protein
MATGKVKIRFAGEKWVRRITFAPEGKQLAAASDKSITIWDLATAKKVLEIPKGSAKGSHDFHPNGKELLLISWWAIEFRDTTEGKLIRGFGGRKNDLSQPGYQVAALSPNGKLVAAIQDIGSDIELLDAESGKISATLKADTSWLSEAPSFSPSGKILVSISRDKSVRIWNGQTGEAILKIPVRNNLTSFAVSPDDKWLAVALNQGGIGNIVSIRELGSGREVFTLTFDTTVIDALSFDSKGSLFAAVRGRTVQVWDISINNKGTVNKAK